PELEAQQDNIRAPPAKGVACVNISHKLDELAAVCDTISVIRDGKHIATTAMADMEIPQIITQIVGRERSNRYPTERHDVGD
ncbi:D-xylose ABC transporter ATP-binding protein, partial [Pseudomonas syringae pv. tagetis]